MMPISDHRDRFFYPRHTPMQDTYFLQEMTSNGRERKLKIGRVVYLGSVVYHLILIYLGIEKMKHVHFAI